MIVELGLDYGAKWIWLIELILWSDSSLLQCFRAGEYNWLIQFLNVYKVQPLTVPSDPSDDPTSLISQLVLSQRLCGRTKPRLAAKLSCQASTSEEATEGRFWKDDDPNPV